jgi:hypothetical protein
MLVGMAASIVPLRNDVVGDPHVALGISSQHEKGGLRVITSQKFEDCGGDRAARAVVICQNKDTVLREALAEISDASEPPCMRRIVDCSS